MQLAYTTKQQVFRAEVRSWMEAHVPKEPLVTLEYREGYDSHVEWERMLASGNWGMVTWPEAYGGRGLDLIQWLIFEEEYFRAGGPNRANQNGIFRTDPASKRHKGLTFILFDLNSPGITRAPIRQLHGETGFAELFLDEVRVPVENRLDGDGETLASVDPLRQLTALIDEPSDDPTLLNLGPLMSAAQLVGLADAMLHQATEYAKIRTQFGQPIGAFQAIKHSLANCAVGIEFAKPAVWRAAQALQDGLGSAAIHVSHAKVAAADSAIQTAETAIQVHGAMGYTYEVDLHFWMKRSWALVGAWGSRAFHLKRIDEAVLGGSLSIGSEHTFA